MYVRKDAKEFLYWLCPERACIHQNKRPSSICDSEFRIIPSRQPRVRNCDDVASDDVVSIRRNPHCVIDLENTSYAPSSKAGNEGSY